MQRITFLLLCLLLGCSPEEQEVESPYNVLLIVIDDLNDWTGFLAGHPQANTPNLDRLAAQSFIFENAHAAAPLCNPSRVAIMTGLRPTTTGIYRNRQYLWDSKALDKKLHYTLPKYFSKNSFTTMAMGKLFHDQSGKMAMEEEWDVFHQPKGRLMTNYFGNDPKVLSNGMDFSNLRHRLLDWKSMKAKFENTSDYHITQFAANELKKEHEGKFFLAAGLFRPHLPWYLPKGYHESIGLDSIILPSILSNDLEDIPPIGTQISTGLSPKGDYQRLIRHNKWAEAVKAYLASIKYADDCVGIILDALEESPHRDNTIVMLFSDHGWHLGEKLHFRKVSLWEEATRVPLLIKIPDKDNQGKRIKKPVSLVDIYPTLVELCELPPNPTLEGRSLVPLLNDPNAAWNYTALTSMRAGRHTVRSERYRYIIYEDGSEELYDHENDAQEWINLAGDPKLLEIKTQLKDWVPKKVQPSIPFTRIH